MKLGINRFRFFAWRIAEEKCAEISGFKFHSHAAFFLIVCQRLADERLVTGQIGGQASHAFLLHVAPEHFFLQWKVDGHVAVPGDQIMVIEREKKRINEEHPVKSFGIKIRRQRHAIGQASLDVHFVEDAVPVSRAARGFRSLLLFDEPLRMLGPEIIIGIAEERFCRGDKFRIRIAQAHHGAFVRWRSHGVHVGIIRERRVRVIVVDGDAIDLLQQAVVNLL